MKREFCTYEQSLALRELGFDEICIGYFDNEDSLQMVKQTGKYNELVAIKNSFDSALSAPLIQQAFRFFRKKYELSYSIIHKQSGQRFESVVYSLYDPTMNHIDGVKTYEEAEQACLDKLIQLAKEK